MKTRLTISIALLLLALQTYPSFAAWGSFVSTGTTKVNSDVSCAPTTGGQAVCAASGFGNTMLVNQFNGSAWSGWKALAGVITSAPSCAKDGNGNVICAARSSSGGMSATVFNGTIWSAEIKVTGALATGPSCASLGGGRVLCAARSATGGLTSSVFNGTAWSAFDSQAATATSAPSCGSDDGGRAICAMRDTAGRVIVNRYNGSAWDGFINIAGLASDEPVCGNFGVSGEAVCFARGTDLALWGARFTGGTWIVAHWTAWGTLGGVINSRGGCAVTISGQLVCGAIAITDSALYVNHYNGTT
jgi:hypothetical protein